MRGRTASITAVDDGFGGQYGAVRGGTASITAVDDGFGGQYGAVRGGTASITAVDDGFGVLVDDCGGQPVDDDDYGAGRGGTAFTPVDHDWVGGVVDEDDFGGQAVAEQISVWSVFLLTFFSFHMFRLVWSPLVFFPCVCVSS